MRFYTLVGSDGHRSLVMSFVTLAEAMIVRDQYIEESDERYGIWRFGEIKEVNFKTLDQAFSHAYRLTSLWSGREFDAGKKMPHRSRYQNDSVAHMFLAIELGAEAGDPFCITA